MRIEDKCIRCGKCRDVCRDVLGVLGTYRLADTNDTAVCINCGQCANVCPTNSIVEKPEVEFVKAEIANPKKVVVFSTSPAVRVSLGEAFGLEPGTFVQGKMIGLLRKLGADYVLDTNFGADLTVMEEANELVDRYMQNQCMPQFTTCCPAWVKYAEIYHPEILPYLSTTKSPIGMQGATVKTYFAQKMNLAPESIVHVCVTPCTAKKMEIRCEEFDEVTKQVKKKPRKDIDYVITVRELAQWAKSETINFDEIADGEFDKYMGQSSGGGVIFGNSGGVMESAIRTVYESITGRHPPERLYHLEEVRGYKDVRAASITMDGKRLNVAVIYGTASADKFIEHLKTCTTPYHFIEVMACPNGCVGGGGQPKHIGKDISAYNAARTESLYKRDEQMPVRACQFNQEIIDVYHEYYGLPCGEKAQQMLHTTYTAKPTNLLPRDQWKHLNKE
jgi:ferredoxin hydrogenase